MFHFISRKAWNQSETCGYNTDMDTEPSDEEDNDNGIEEPNKLDVCSECNTVIPGRCYFRRLMRLFRHHIEKECNTRYEPKHLESILVYDNARLDTVLNWSLEGDSMTDPLGEQGEFDDISKKVTSSCLFASFKREFRYHIEKECLGKYEMRHLDALRKWLKLYILPLVDEIRHHNSTISKLLAQSKRFQFESDLEHLLNRVFGETVSDEIFSICIDFPDSQPILLDLRQCLKTSNIRDTIVTKLKQNLEKRLLHAGVSTVDVVEAYVSTVRALKFLDPDGVLLQLVTPSVRDYLKRRDETIRVILVNLTEESGELAEELARNPTEISEQANLEHRWRQWVPDPIDIPRDKYNLRQADLIQTLVSIYGSKYLFIDEYRNLLADRLLKMPKPTSITRELKCLELLKLRFGDSDLQKCEVMLKDVGDSQRMNTRYNEEQVAITGTQDLSFSGLIVSAQFWPSFKQEELKLPPLVKEACEKYIKCFEAIKGNRSLEFLNHIGTVEIEIEHLGTTTTYTCTPANAIIIWHFQDEKTKWTLQELSEATGMAVKLLRLRIRHWVTRGILLEGKADTYSLQEAVKSGSGKRSSMGGLKYLEEEEMDSPMTSTSTLREVELQIFWSYIEGMLTNLETLPLTRIHSMLKLFATVECSSEELQKFLDDKVSKGILVYSSGQYQLSK